MFCTNCGAKMEDDLQFCTECGNRLALEQVAEEPQPNEPIEREAPPSKPKVTLSPLMLAATLCFTAMLAFQLTDLFTTDWAHHPLLSLLNLADLSRSTENTVKSMVDLLLPLGIVIAIPTLLMVAGLWIHIFRRFFTTSERDLGLVLVRWASILRMIESIILIACSTTATIIGWVMIKPFADDGGFQLGGQEYAMTTGADSIRWILFMANGVIVLWSVVRVLYGLSVLSVVKKMRNPTSKRRGASVAVLGGNILFALVTVALLAALPFIPQLLEMGIGMAETATHSYLRLDISVFSVSVYTFIQTALSLLSLSLFFFVLQRQRKQW